MNELQVFNNAEFGEFSLIEIDGKPYFPATRSAKVLGYSNPQEAIRAHCKGVREILTPSNGGNQRVNHISEGDLYRLIVRSNLPGAERFERWVFDEILPSIRKTGSYIATPKTYLEALEALVMSEKEKQRLQAKAEEDRPKVEFFDQVADSKDAMDMRRVAAVLNVPDLGRNKLHEFLREKKIFDANNIPYREFQDRGYFRVVEKLWYDSRGKSRIVLVTLTTQKGLGFIRRLVTEAGYCEGAA